MAHLFDEVAYSWLDKEPGALVLGLFLGPSDGSILVACQLLFNITEWEGSNLFNPHNGNILNAALCTFSLKVEINLTTAEDNLFNLGVRDQVFGGFWNGTSESKACLEFFYVGRSATELQKFLRDSNNKRLAERSANLASQQMEVVCCGSAVGKREVHMLSDPSLSLLLSRWHIISI